MNRIKLKDTTTMNKNINDVQSKILPRIEKSEHNKNEEFMSAANFIKQLQNKRAPRIKLLLIPFILKQIYPGLSLVEYQKLKEDVNFLNQTTFVCEECYLCISLASECSGMKLKIPKITKKVVLKRLNPEKVGRRRDITQKRIEGVTGEDSPEKNFTRSKFVHEGTYKHQILESVNIQQRSQSETRSRNNSSQDGNFGGMFERDSITEITL